MDRPIGRLPPRKQPLPPLARSDAPLPSPPSDLGPPEANLKGTRTGEGERAPASRGREAVQLPKHSAQALNGDPDARRDSPSLPPAPDKAGPSSFRVLALVHGPEAGNQ